jgi:hypothetical protein
MFFNMFLGGYFWRLFTDSAPLNHRNGENRDYKPKKGWLTPLPITDILVK